jgi:hypothetical protein
MASLKALIEKVSNTIITEASYASRTIAEYITGSFSIPWRRFTTDVINLAESLANLFGKNVQDGANFSDQIDQIDFGKNPGDPLNFIDSFDRTIQFFREPTDSLNITDPLQSSFGKPLQHTTQLSDTAFVQMLFNVGLTDPLYLTDDLNGAAIDDDQTVSFFKISSEQINFSDQIDLTTLFDRTPTDQTNISTTGLIVSQNYINGADYFLEDYVGVSRTIT